MAQAKVRSYTRADGTRVKGHSRNYEAWKKAGGAWLCAGASGATAAALVAQLGFTLIGAVAAILTAILSVLAAALSVKAAKPKRRTMRTSRLITVSAPARKPAKRKTKSRKRR